METRNIEIIDNNTRQYDWCLGCSNSILISGTTGVGKTNLALKYASEHLKKGYKVYIFTDYYVSDFRSELFDGLISILTNHMYQFENIIKHIKPEDKVLLIFDDAQIKSYANIETIMGKYRNALGTNNFSKILFTKQIKRNFFKEKLNLSPDMTPIQLFDSVIYLKKFYNFLNLYLLKNRYGHQASCLLKYNFEKNTYKELNFIDKMKIFFLDFLSFFKK